MSKWQVFNLNFILGEEDKVNYGEQSRCKDCVGLAKKLQREQMDNVSSEVSGYSQNLSTVLWMSKNSTSHSRPWHVAPSLDRDTVGSSTENCFFLSLVLGRRTSSHLQFCSQMWRLGQCETELDVCSLSKFEVHEEITEQERASTRPPGSDLKIKWCWKKSRPAQQV